MMLGGGETQLITHHTNMFDLSSHQGGVTLLNNTTGLTTATSAGSRVPGKISKLNAK
jgi:hypothetical protein